MVPDGWEQVKIGDILERVKKPVIVDPEKEYREIGIRSHGKGIFHKELVKGEALGNKSVFWVEPHCFICNIVFAWEQAVAVTTSKEEGFIASHRFPMYKSISDKVSVDYLLYVFKSKRGKYLLEMASPGGAGRNKTLGQAEFAKISILLPPISIQKRIVEILSTWGSAISLVERKLLEKKKYKKVLANNMLTGFKRFSGFPDWEEKHIGDLIAESRLLGSNGDIAKKLTVKLHGKGVKAKNEKRPGSKSTKYYKRKSGQFIYSKLDFLNGAFGIVPDDLSGYESTLDLPAFDFIGNVDSTWFINLVSRESFYKANLGLANGGRKARRVNPKDFLGIQVAVPHYKEQKRIASVLIEADHEIEVLDKKLNVLKREKKSLMQQLLSGREQIV